MTINEDLRIRLHHDPALFLEAVAYTEATTGFIARLIEKDYFCSVVLQYLKGVSDLVFRGGTCLAKFHSEFYRLSEDLDFVIPTPVDVPRSERSHRALAAKQWIATIGDAIPGLRAAAPLTGSNESTQYRGTVAYDSLLGSGEEAIKIEVSLREQLCESPIEGPLRTLLLDPISGFPRVPPVPFPCLSWREAVAEKIRAALTRREVAIRDFYDLDHAVRRKGLDLLEPDLVSVVESKIEAPGNAAIDVSPERLGALRLQLESELKPVLRPRDFEEFDLKRAIGIATTVATAVG